MQQFHFDIIGTHLVILVDTEDSISDLTNQIETRLSLFEQKYSRFIPGNWLDALNRERSGILDRDGQTMLSMMLDIASATDGYFDPTIGKKLTELGYGNNETTKQLESDVVSFGDYRDITLDNNQVILHGNIELEFGGIGKWYLIDVIHSLIEASEFATHKSLINFGWDMYGRGDWNIGLESPFAADEVIGTIVLDDLYLACSAGTKRKWGNHHHLINPHTGESARDVIASFIEWDSGMITDGYATALCVMPWELACATFQKISGISGAIISKEGYIFQKEGSRSEIFE